MLTVRRLAAAVALALLVAGCSTDQATGSTSSLPTSTAPPTTAAPTTTVAPTTTTPPVPGASLGPHVGALALVADVEVDGVPPMVADPTTVEDERGEFLPALADAPNDRATHYEVGCHADVPDLEADPACVLGPVEGTIDVAVVGDSKMGQWVDALLPIAEAEGWRLRMVTKSGCPVTEYMVQVRQPDRTMRDYVECQTFARNTLRTLTTPGQVPDLVLFSQGQSGQAADGGPDPEMVAAVGAMWAGFSEAGARVVAFADVPNPTRPAGNVLRCIADHPDDYAACRFPRNDGTGTPALRAAADADPAVTFVDMNDWVCPTPSACPTVVGGVLVYRQTSHLTKTYVRSLAPILHRVLVEAGVADGPEMPLAPVGSVGS